MSASFSDLVALQDLSTATPPPSHNQSTSHVPASATPADPLFSAQWHLLNVGQNGGSGGVDIDITPVWESGYTGKGISIGVYDTAMDVRHADLSSNIDLTKKIVAPGYANPTKLSTYGDEHATAVAGVIGALRNGDEVVGVAYNAKITPIDIFGGDDSYVWEALRNQSKFDVTNHSWGFTGSFVANQLNTAEHAQYLAGFAKGAIEGRGGLGTIEIVAAGNYRQNGLTTETNGLTLDRHVITVGATDDQGSVSYYSNPGASLLVVAPSSGDTNGIVTDDITGARGYSAGDYTDNFGGTSAATPQLSGIVATMLQANPKLGWRDVQDILAISARHTGSEMDSSPERYELDGWSFNNAANWNGGGMHFSNDYGFGLVDAQAAVALAETWSVMHGAARTSANELVTTKSLTGTWDIGHSDTNTFKFTLKDNISIESVVLDFSKFTFSDASDLIVELISPDGTSCQLLNCDGFSGSSIKSGWELMSREFNGENAQGIWTLNVTNTDTSNVGTLSLVTLKAYGSAISDNSVFFYTDEFAKFWDPSRATLSSASTATINAAAVTGEVQIDLSSGEGTVAGAELNIAEGTSVDLVIGGSGGNTIQASNAGSKIYGGRGIDTLSGGNNIDKMYGAAGSDLLEGGRGNDVLDGGAGFDTASYEHATAAVTVSLAITAAQKTGGAGIDKLASFEKLTGSAFNDALTGNTAKNILDGGAGNDVLMGGRGADSLRGGLGIDTASYSASKQGINVNLSAGTGLGGEAQGDSLSGIENLIGSASNDVLTGDSQDNVLAGGAGNDSLSGGEGADRLLGGAGADIIDGGDGSDTVSYAGSTAVSINLGLTGRQGGAGHETRDILRNIENVIGSAKNDSIIGNAAANILSGDAGNDILEGGDGADILNGGAGIDAISYKTSSTAVTVNLDSRTGLGGDAEGDILLRIENVRGSAFDDILIGNASANVLGGGAGNDTIEGGSGNDILKGGSGSDTASYEHATVAVAVNLAITAAQRTGAAGVDTLSSFENLAGSDFNDTLTGNAAANILSGRDGNDALIGGGGADFLDGGVGIDTASYQTSKQGVSVDLSAGIGLGGEAEGDSFSGIENLVGSASNDVLTGDGQDNVISGGAGNDRVNGGEGDDILLGGIGADIIDGGDGSDTVSYAGSAAVSINLSLADRQGGAGDAALDILRNIENVIGSAKNDSIIGDAADNILSGGRGNDVLEGGAGADVLNGGVGIDVASYDASSSAVTVNLGTRTGLGGEAEGDILLGLENVRGSSFGDVLIGDAGANFLAGGAGNDTVEGGSGNDILNGGAGSDTASYEHATAAVAVSLAVAVAQQTGGAGIDTLSLFENLTGSAFNDALTGNAEANNLSGGDGNDVLLGGGGADRLNGDDGIDTASYSASKQGVNVDLSTGIGLGGDAEGDSLSGIENLIGSAANDTLTGDSQDNVISGGAGNDSLNGGEGNDTLLGGAGADILNGGAGSDTFRYCQSSDGGDLIFNFNAGEGDKIEIVKSTFGIEGGVALNAGDAWDFAQHYFVSGDGVTATESGHGQFLFNTANGALSWDADGLGGQAETLIATLNGHTLLASDFVLA